VDHTFAITIFCFDEQAGQILSIADAIAERVRKVGGNTLCSIGHIGRLQRIVDNDAECVDPLYMLSELREDNKALAQHARSTRSSAETGDVTSTSLLETWIDEAQPLVVLFESTRKGD
jgi:starvation-inducible DNA-binding protein